MNYDVVYILKGRRKVGQWEGPNPGTAFAKCLKSNPAARLISAHTYRKSAGGCNMWMDYTAPSIARPEPLPSEPRKQVEMELNDPRRP